MRKAVQSAILFATLFVAAASAWAQSPAKDETAKDEIASGSISGMITINGKPARRVKVVALSGGPYNEKPVAMALTDEGGRYHLKGVPAGSCLINAEAPAFALKDTDKDRRSSGKSVALGEGENVEGIDFDLMPGGVITGRVTDANGRPLIGESVAIIPFTGSRYKDLVTSLSWLRDKLQVSTDDRGIYRAYGLPPGRYKISVGNRFSSTTKPSFGQVPLPLTYHPGVTKEPKAEVVEISEGGEAINIDIKVSRPSVDKTKAFAVTGRIVDAETGKPLPEVGFYLQSHESYDEEEDSDSTESISEHDETDPRGEFRVEGLPPGKYEIVVSTDEDNPWYSKKVIFQISNANVEGIEVKAYRAGSISGVVVLEGARDPAVTARFSKLKVGRGSVIYSGTQINSDGTFQLTGIGPGPYNLGITTDGRKEGFELLRIERDGVEQKTRMIEVSPGEQVTGVRLVVAYYRGVIRGQIKIEGGALPKGALLMVSATPTNKPKVDLPGANGRFSLLLSRWRLGSIDARGQFVIEALPPGEYEVNLDAYLTHREKGGKDDDEDNYKIDKSAITLTKIVTVTDVGETVVSFVLDLSKKPEGKRQ